MTREPLSRFVGRLRQTLDVDGPAAQDEELLRRFRDTRDPAAFEAIVRRHGPGVLSACRKVLADEADVEDAFQAAFVILLRDARSIRKGSAVGSWLYGVAHRVALKARAARRRRAQVEAGAGPNSEHTPDLSWREAVGVLHEELDKLPERYRLPLMLCYLEGLSRDETAQRLGLSLNAIRNRLERARSRLRARLQHRGITLSAGLLAAVTGSVSMAVPASLVRSTIAGRAGPSARVAALVGGATGTGVLKVVAGLAVAAGLVIGIGLGNEGLRAGPSPKEPPSKEMPAKPMAKKDGAISEEKAPENLAVRGKVLDPDARPVKGAKVWLLLQPRAVRRTAPGWKVVATTDADGAFAFAEDGTGRRRHWAHGARLVATADGFGPVWAAAADAKDKPLVLKLVKDEPVSGRILTLEGKPLAGARVRVIEVTVPQGPDLSPWLAEVTAKKRPLHEIASKYFHFEGRLFEAEQSLPGQPAAITTDADGRFRLTGLGRERLATVRIEGPTIATVERPVMTRATPTLTVPEHPGDSRYGMRTYYGATFDFAADPSQPYEGVVTDRDTGKQVAGVKIRANREWYEVSTVTDKGGKYRLTGLPTGPNELMALPPPDQPYHRMAASGGEKASQKPAKVDFALTRGHWVTGKLVNARTNKPEAGAPVWYFPFADEPGYLTVPGSHAWSMDATTFTKEDGSFRVVAFPCRGAIVANGWGGGYLSADQRPLQGDVGSLDRGLSSDHDLATSPVVNLGSYNAAAIVNVDPKKPKEYTITLDPGLTVKVRLVDPDGKPVSGASVGGQSTWSLWTPNQKPEVELTEYNPDRPRSVLFLHPEKGIGKLVEPTKGDVGPWDVKLEPTGSVTGRLVTADGKPVANAVLQVHYRLPGHDAWTPSFAHDEARTDDQGRFRLANLVGGLKYSVLYSAQQGASRTQHYLHIQVKAGEAKDLGDQKPAGVD
jgi:RNA polymerase sigma factor (sigma-70 family)